MAHLADEEDRYLDAHAIRSVEHAEVPLNGQLRFLTINVEAAFERSALVDVPAVPLRRAIRLIASALGGDLDFHQLATIANGLALSPGSVTSEGGTVIVEWSEDQVHLRQAQPREPFRFPLTVPGATDSETFGWTIEATPAEGAVQPFVRNALDVVLDFDKAKGPLFLRAAELGDVIAPMGFEKARKLSDLMGEAKLTQAARRRLPIICDILGVVWVPGICLADRVKTGAATSRQLRLRFGPPATGSVDSS
jgi:tRNA(Ile)-lysidine synthase